MSLEQNTVQGLVPPQNLDAEKALLGGLLLDCDAFDKVSFLRADNFYSLQHKVIYETICEIINAGNRPDILVLTETLRSKDSLDKAGGRAYIASLPSLVPTAINIEYYANLILDAALKRDLISISADVHSSCFQSSVKAHDLLEQAQQKFFAISEAGQKATYFTPKEIVGKVLNIIEEREKHSDELAGVPSGFQSLDYLSNGFQDSDLIIIAARPSLGKTALALSMFLNMTVHSKIPAAFFSLEMSKEQIMQRLFAIEANIPLNSMQNGRLKTSDLSRLSDAASEIYESPLFLVDVPNMRLLDLKAIARQLVRVENVKAILIDYIGLIATDRPDLPVYEQVAEISKNLKALARELNIPIIALSQVNREAEGKTPSLATIRGSGAVEQDADLVMFLNRSRDTSGANDENSEGVETDLIVSKHRNGATGTIKLVFKAVFTKYAEKI